MRFNYRLTRFLLTRYNTTMSAVPVSSGVEFLEAFAANNESVIRELRDRVYGRFFPDEASEENWQNRKENWMKGEAMRWLLNRKENCRVNARVQTEPITETKTPQ